MGLIFAYELFIGGVWSAIVHIYADSLDANVFVSAIVQIGLSKGATAVRVARVTDPGNFPAPGSYAYVWQIGGVFP